MPITDSGIVGNTMPIPMLPIAHPTYGTTNGTSRRPAATTGAPAPISIPPNAVSRRAPRRPITLDCHHEPAAQASADAVITMPAAPDRKPSRLREHQRDEAVDREERCRREEGGRRRGRESPPGGERA